MRKIGSTITTITKTIPMITTWFYFLTKNDGKAIPTLKEDVPSGLPNFRQFYLAV